MTRSSRPAAVAALLLTAFLALPAGGLAARGGVRQAGDGNLVAVESGWTLFGSYLQAAWSWIRGQFDEDNGYIVP